MRILGKAYSTNLTKLWKQTEAISDRPVRFYPMLDCPPKAFISHVIAYTHVCTDQAAVFLSNDVREIDVAHELVEAQLRLEGFPSIAVRRRHSNLFNFAQLLDSTIGHVEVNHRLKTKGFDVQESNAKRIQELLEAGKRQPAHDRRTDRGKIILAALGYVDTYFRHDDPTQLAAIDNLYTNKFSNAKGLALTLISVIQDKGFTDPTSALTTTTKVIEILDFRGILIPLSDGETKSFTEWLDAMRN